MDFCNRGKKIMITLYFLYSPSTLGSLWSKINKILDCFFRTQRVQNRCHIPYHWELGPLPTIRSSKTYTLNIFSFRLMHFFFFTVKMAAGITFPSSKLVCCNEISPSYYIFMDIYIAASREGKKKEFFTLVYT